MILNLETIRESVWLYAWGKALEKGNSPRQSAKCCLEEFDKQFPEHKKYQSKG